MLRRWKHNSTSEHFLGWLQGFAEIADGLVTILSFGFYSSSFEMEISKQRALHTIKRRGKYGTD